MKRCLPLLVLLLASACSVKPELKPDEADRVRTFSGIARDLGGDDPIEPFNRAMFATNDALMNWLVRPLGWVYGSVVPKEGIKRINMVADNLAFPGRMVSCFCQAKWTPGGIVFVRFLANSTIGVVGIFDPADHFWNLKKRHENMGHAFACWGIGPGPVVWLPLMASTNMRDHVGTLFDSVLDLKFFIPYAGYVVAVNRAVSQYDSYKELTESMADPYDTSKTALLVLRYTQLQDMQWNLLAFPPEKREYKLPEGMGKAPVLSISSFYDPMNQKYDTLRNPLFRMCDNRSSWWVKTSVWNTDFVSRRHSGSVRLREDLPELHYDLWFDRKKNDAELVVVLPGVGTHYSGANARAFAELLVKRGYAVVVISNAMNHEFAAAAGTYFPGYVPRDAASIREFLALIRKDAARRFELKPKRNILFGYSLGGLYTLKIAEAEEKENHRTFDRYVAVNPPVDLLYSMRVFDTWMEVSKKWNKSDFFRYGGDALVKFLYLGTKDFPYLPSDGNGALYRTGLSSEQSAVLAGLSFRLTIRELLISAAKRGAEFSVPWSWGNRSALYREIDPVDGKTYVEKYAVRGLSGKTVAEMNRESGLRIMKDFLRVNEKIRVLHNLDDPILAPSDKIFLDSTLGNRLRWTDRGAHLGNLYVIPWQEQFLNALK